MITLFVTLFLTLSVTLMITLFLALPTTLFLTLPVTLTITLIGGREESLLQHLELSKGAPPDPRLTAPRGGDQHLSRAPIGLDRHYDA